ncbi:MAG: hypothetical protein WC426_14295, partial [Sulfuriferula sp.]
VAQAMGKIGPATTAAIGNIDTLRQSLIASGETAQAIAPVIAQALGNAINTARSQADLNALSIKLKQLESAGNSSALQIQHLTDQIEAQRRAIDPATIALNNLYQSLGLVNKAVESSKLDKEAADLDALRESGSVTAAEYYKLADAIKAQRDALSSSGDSKGKAAEANNNLSNSAKDAATSTQNMTDAVDASGSIAAAVAGKIDSALASIGTLSKQAEEAARTLRTTTNDWRDWASAVGALDPRQFVSQDQALSGLNDQLKSFQAQAKSAGEQAAYLKEQAMFGPGIEWNQLSDGLSKIYSFTKGLAEAKAEMAQFQIAQYNISAGVKDGSISLEEQAQKLEQLKSQYRDLDKASLQALQSQIDQVNASLKSMSDAADQTLANLQSQLAQAQGKLAEQATIDAQQKVLDLQNKINAAKTAGNEKAVAELQKALQVQQQLNDLSIKQARAQEAQAKASATSNSSQAGQAAVQPVKTIKIQAPDGTSFDVLASQESQVTSFIAQLTKGKAVAS